MTTLELPALDPRTTDFALGDFRESAYVARARELVPILRERARRQWATNRLLDETAALIHQAGFFRMLQPARFGGGETSPMEWLETVTTLAEGDPSVAWVTGVLGIHSFHLAHFEERAQQEVWGTDERALLSSPYAPNRAQRVAGGFRLSGVWKFASGVHHCDYALLGGAVYADEEAVEGADRLRLGDYRAFLVPRAQFHIQENWDVHGMRGTGSHDIVVSDAFVPEYRTLPFRAVIDGTAPGKRTNPGVLYRLPFFQVLGRVTTSPVPLGALKAMCDAFCEISRGRVSNRGVKTAQDPMACMAIADALAAIDEIKGNSYRNLGRQMQAAARGEALSLDERQMFRYQTAAATFRIAQLGTAIYKSCGGSGIYENVPFGRLLNDINAVIGHTSNNYQLYAYTWAGGRMGLDVSGGDLRA